LKNHLILILFACTICINTTFGQTNSINISAKLDTENNELIIQQEIIFYNKSGSILNEIYFHNWPNAYKDKNTPLAKRFIENYSKSFHFTKDKNRGFTYIKNISVNYHRGLWKIDEKNPDILKINLENPLQPKDFVSIIVNYIVKVPRDKFTRYGVNTISYNLRYWYLAPAIYQDKWITYNNLDMDDLYIDYSNYTINFQVPQNYDINSDLSMTLDTINNMKTYLLVGEKKLDIELNITKNNDFVEFKSNPVSIITNLSTEKLSTTIQTEVLTRELDFLKSYLGEFPNKKLLINQIEYDKNPVYGLNQLPSFITPFNDVFEWDVKLFKILSKKYIENVFLFNQREDIWLADALQTYLMIKYVEKYYPEMKAIGAISKIWGIKKFNLAKIGYNDKYAFVYQFAARKNLDQALTTPADSLSNFNRKIVNKYKAGLGLQYLENYINTSAIKVAIINFSRKYSGKPTNSYLFFDEIKTNKDINWFKNDFLNSSKKIDYTIKKIVQKNDSIEVSVLNKRHFTAPIQLYGIKDNEIKFKKWLIGVDSLTTITIPKNGFDRLSLNYELQLPEYNLKNNWKNVDKKLFHRPVQLKFLKDIEDPYYNELFYTPVYRFNYYDGLVLGMAISNKTIQRKSFAYKITPSYSMKSNSFSGSYSFIYEYLPENKKINRFTAGISGSTYHYAENLTYSSLNPYAILEFKRKNLRDVRSKAIVATYTLIDREKAPDLQQNIETNKYGVFNLGYGYAKPDIIDDLRFSTGIEVSSKFSKLSVTARYRKLTDTNRQFDFRFFAGAFISNKTETDFFSFALDRPTDYLFQYDYLGRSETSGIFSQQIIINEGGFKSKLPVPFANEWLSTLNTSIGLWRWFEIYSDVGLVKNKNEKVFFAHENGVRLNFIQDILEVYFPFHSNLGWEIADPNYSSKIRFVLVINPKRIYNFIKRGFY
jgi:hypothetical protein